MEFRHQLPQHLPGSGAMPLVEALLAWERAGRRSFHTPGHRQGRELEAQATVLPRRVYSLDATELRSLDDLHHPRGVIAEAQRLLAELYGADESYFLVGGSTAGILGALLATAGPGQKVVMARYSHRAAFAATILAGCQVRYLPERWGRDGLPLGPSPAEAVRMVLEWRPAVLLLTRPNYYGIGFPLEEVAAACRRTGTVLVVDEAHGAHWRAAGLPSALEAGADVVVQSAHKTLPALTQAAWLHRQGTRVDPERLRASLRMVQSSSPSYLLMASLDVARFHLQRWVQEASGRLQQVTSWREELARAGLPLLPRQVPPGWVYDPWRLVVDTRALGWDGRRVADFLEGAGIEVEWGEPDRVLLLLGLRGADEGVAGEVLVRLLSTPPPGREDAVRATGPYPCLPAVIDPGLAWWSEQEAVPLGQAGGRVAADLLYFSPPGVPVVAPGERWTEGAVAFLRGCLEAGLEPAGWHEPGLVRVVKESGGQGAGREKGR